MGEKVIHVSDLSGQTAAQEELARLIVEQHPEIEEPVKLEALPTEIAPLDKAAITAVVLMVRMPGEEQPMRRVIPVDKFDKLATNKPMAEVLAEAAPAVAKPTIRRSHNTRTDGSPLINYNQPENAGFDHQGRIGKQEAAFVRDNLELINARRAERGQRPIDPANPEDAKRYDFAAPEAGETTQK